MYLLAPVLSELLFTGIHFDVDVYSSYHLEQLHDFSREICRFLKQGFCNMLNDSEQMSTAILTSKLDSRAFWQIRRKVPGSLNEFMNETEANATRFGLCQNFYKMCSDSLFQVILKDNFRLPVWYKPQIMR